MSAFHVFPIADTIADQIRETRVDDLGHDLTVSLATINDTGPCRSCLTVIKPGEGKLLFSFAPNPHNHPYNEIGPIYIHENRCEPYKDYNNFPPELRTRRPLTLRCYDETGVMIGGELVGDRPIEQVIGKLFEDSNVKYLHARTATVGCFVARVERARSVNSE